MVDAFSSEGAVDSLDETVLPGRVRSGLDWFYLEIANTFIESGTEDLVPVVNQEPRFGPVSGEGFDYLAQCPRGRRVGRDIEVDDASSVVTQNHQAVQKLEERRRNDDKVARSSDLHVVSEESHPGLTRTAAFRTYPVLINCGLGHRVTEELEFQMDPRATPQRVLAGQAFDQTNQVRIDSGATWLLAGPPPPNRV